MNYIKKTLLCLLALSGGLASCTKDFSEINAQLDGFTKEQLRGDSYEISASFPKLQSIITPAESSGFFQHFNLTGDVWARYMEANAKWAGRSFSTYGYDHEGWLNTPFHILSDFYPEYRKVKESTEGQGVVFAWAQVIRVAVMHRLTDLYGPIPYSQISAGNLFVPYDSQEQVYKSMLRDLDEAIATLTAYTTTSSGEALMPSYDRIYQGDMVKWVRLANSLKLRLAMRMRYAEPALAKTAAEEAVAHPIGVISQNADNAFYRQQGNNLLWLIGNAWNDCRVAADITSYMNGYADPRRSAYFLPTSFSPATFDGIRSGSRQDGGVYVKYSSVNVSTSAPTIILTASEVAFLKAEGALAGWAMGDTPQALYEQGVRLSFEQWGVSGADTYLQGTTPPADYTDPSGAYSTGAASTITVQWDDAATDEVKLERIITQKWIALWPLGMEAWSEHRRTGYPRFMPIATTVETAYSALQVANRLPFARTEFNQNAENVRAAIGLLGGEDNYATKMWWQKKN